MSYRANSNWNEKNEILCLIIFKKLEEAKFPPRKQIEYCRNMSIFANLSPENISAKVCNYKSVAGINKDSNASINTVNIFKKYGQKSIKELEKFVNDL